MWYIDIDIDMIYNISFIYICLYIYMRCYSAIKKNEVMLLVVTWMGLEIIILN